MALNLTYNNLINPCYSDISIGIYDTVNHALTNLTYRVDVSIDGELTSYEQYPDITDNGVFNIEGTLQGYFAASIPVHSTLNYNMSNNLKKYDIYGYSLIDSSIIASTSKTGFYSFYGADRTDKPAFDASVYMLRSSTNKFLNYWEGKHELELTDDLYISYFSGTFNGSSLSLPTYDSSFAGLEVVTYTNDSSTTNTISISLSSTPYIYSANIGPSSLNTLNPSIGISETTTKYTVQERNHRSEIIEIYIKAPSLKTNRTYRLYYVGQLGDVQGFNFDLINTNSIAIDKLTYKSNKILKSYITEIEDKYNIISDWMDDNTALNLKELWYSPYICESSTYRPIVLDLKSQVIKQRRNTGLVNYDTEFTYANEYRKLKY